MRKTAHWELSIGGREIELQDGENIVGRERSAKIRIEAPSISRRHARLIVDGEQVTVEDLCSKNGTSVRGKRIHLARLTDGDMIEFGTVVASILMIRAEPSTETDPSPIRTTLGHGREK